MGLPWQSSHYPHSAAKKKKKSKKVQGDQSRWANGSDEVGELNWTLEVKSQKLLS